MKKFLTLTMICSACLFGLAGCWTGSSGNHTLRSEKSITAFSFVYPFVEGVINEENHNISLTVPFNSDVTALVPYIIHSGVSINPASGVSQNFTNPVIYTVTAEDDSTNDYAVTVNIAPDSSKAITAFSFASPAANGIINQTNHTIVATVPFNTVVTALVPTIVHTGASINPVSGVAQNFTNPVIYTVTADDASTQNYTVTVNIAPNSSKAITAFNFANPNAVGIISEASYTIGITVPFNTNVTALVPSITHTGAIINPASGVAQNFTNPVIYTVTAADASTQDYTVTVKKEDVARWDLAIWDLSLWGD